jgi:hypothetical protein
MLSEANVYVNVTYVTDVIKIIEWDKCLCKCYIYDCSYECYICDWCSQNKYEKCWVR